MCCKNATIPAKLVAARKIYISRPVDTDTQRQRTMKNKKPKIDKNLTTLAFVDKETNSLVIHVHGFENSDIAEAFASYLLTKSGMSYETANNLFDCIPTIH